MFEMLLTIPYYFGKDAELVAALQARAPSHSRGVLFSYLRDLKRGRPKLTVVELEEYLSRPVKYNPLFEVELEIVRENDGAKFVVDTLWALDGHVHPPSYDDPALRRFLKVAKKMNCAITVTLKEDRTVHAEVDMNRHAFFTPDITGLQAWYSERYDENGQAKR
jgi:hypothetical protein